ncbi:MAG: cell division protein FtsZ [Zoogloeaceae bacterium]|jgi:cell division protein FtsZ|nr:cell division protein FtsZ [Zoogloeaceae bacterium]
MPEFYEVEQDQPELEDFCDADAAAKILVIGVGGGGGNALNHMISEGIEGVDFLAINTDAQALRTNHAHGRMMLYSEALGKKKGLGAGGKPLRAREAAEASLDKLRERLEGYDMVFITAGMGGGTGTGAASVIAQLAKEMDILTVGVVTRPSEGEGSERLANAEMGIKALTPHVDALLVILNDKLKECMSVPRPTLLECFSAANDVLKNAVAGIVEIITRPGLINVDFNDVKAVLESTGRALMGMATIPAGDIVAMNGQGRASIAVQQAIKSPLLEGVDFTTAKAVLLNITAPPNFQWDEVDEALATIKSFAVKDANVIHGVVIDESMGDSLRVTIIAAGLDLPKPSLSIVNQATGTDDAIGRHLSPSEEQAIPAIYRRNKTVGSKRIGGEPAQNFAPLQPRRPAMIGSGRGDGGVMRRDGGKIGNRAMPDPKPPAFLTKQAD